MVSDDDFVTYISEFRKLQVLVCTNMKRHLVLSYSVASRYSHIDQQHIIEDRNILDIVIADQ